MSEPEFTDITPKPRQRAGADHMTFYETLWGSAAGISVFHTFPMCVELGRVTRKGANPQSGCGSTLDHFAGQEPLSP